ncbi:MAG: beta strand repeat-containing protein, partial [Planctomycetota bacterium]
INLSTHADVRQEGRLTVKVYGLAGSPGGYSSAIYSGQQRVEIGSGATVTALGDINLLAGRTSSFSMNRFNLKAYTDLFNGTAFGFSRKGAEARAEVDNQVIVASGANILGNADVNLVAEKGFSPILVGNALSQSLLEAITNSKDIDRNEKDKSTSGVVVNGTVRTGIKKDQVLVIKEELNIPGTPGPTDPLPYGIIFDLVQTTPSLIDPSVNPGVRVPAPMFVNVGAGFNAQIEKLRALKQEYANDAGALTGFNARIDALYRQAADLGILNSFANPPTIRNDYLVPYIVVPEIVAGVGSIYVFGENFSGSGELNSPLDAKIQITNNSPYGLQLLGLTIPFRTGGKLLYNTGGTDFAPVSSAQEIISRNQDKSLSLAGMTITAPGNATGTATPAQAAPVIRVENTWTNPEGTGKNSKINLSQIPDPDINITGDVNNTGGKVTLISPGSVIINGNLSAQTVEITAGRDFVLNSDGFFSSGGDPKGQWAAEYKQVQAQFFNDPKKNNTNVDLNTASGVATWVRQNINTPKQGGTILALNNIYIAAEYLNIDGTIQSGRPDNTLVIPASRQAEINAFRNNYRPGNSKYLRLSSADQVGIDAFYNAETNRIEVRDAVVKGGYIQLMGRTFSTGNGSIKVMDGFGNITIDNQTSYELEVRKLDTGGVGIEGKIVIIDTSSKRALPLDVSVASASKASDKLLFTTNPYLSTGEEVVLNSSYAGLPAGSYFAIDAGKEGSQYAVRLASKLSDATKGQWADLTADGGAITVQSNFRPLKTEYTRIGNTITKKTYHEVLQGGQLTPVQVNTSTSTGRTAANYSNTTGMRYVWMTGQGILSQIKKEYITSSFWGMDDWSPDPGQQPDRIESRILSNEPLLEGEFLMGYQDLAYEVVPTVSFQGGSIVIGSTTVSSPMFGMANNNQVFAYGYRNKTLSEKLIDHYTFETSSGWGPWEKTYLHDVSVYEKLTKDFHTFSVKADYEVPVRFIGYDAGTVDVTSRGSILITKGVNNPLGSTSFKSTQGSIDAEGFTSINGQVINLEAAMGIGLNSVIRTDLIGANSRLSAVTTTGAINLREVTGQLTYENITTDLKSDVNVFADTSIVPVDTDALIRGRKLTLTATNGSIGASTNLPAAIETSPERRGGILAYAASNAYLYQATGNLWVNSVTATAGEAWIKLERGGFIDNNINETTDTRTQDELVAVWEAARLTGTAADESVADNIAAEENLRTRQYFNSKSGATIRYTTKAASSVDVAANTISFANAHSYTTGTAVIYRQTAGATAAITSVDPVSDIISFATDPGFATGAMVNFTMAAGPTSIGGLLSGSNYYLIRSASNAYRLAATPADATTGKAIDLTMIATGNGASGTANTFSFASDPGIADGSAVKVSRISGNAVISGIAADTAYYAKRVTGTNTYTLAATANGQPIDFSLTANFPIQTVDYEADTITFATAPGLAAGDQVTFNRDSGNSAVTGLTIGGTYFLIKVDDFTFKLAATNNGPAIDLKLDGTLGSGFSLSKSVDSTTSVFSFDIAAAQSPQAANLRASKADIGGLTSGATYYAIAVDSTTISLAASTTDATAGNAIDLTSVAAGSVNEFSTQDMVNGKPVYVDGSGTVIDYNPDYQYRILVPITGASSSNNSITFGKNAISGVSGNTITTTGAHGFADGDRVVYQVAAGGTAIGGLANGTTYYAIVSGSGGATTLQLAATPADAKAGLAINLTSSGSGSQSLVNPSRTHSYKDGDEVTYQVVSPSGVGGLTSGTKYFVKVVDSNTIQLLATSTATSPVTLGGYSGEARLVNDIAYFNKLSKNSKFTEADLSFSIGGGLLNATRTTAGTEVRIESANVTAGGKLTLLAEGQGGFIGRDSTPISAFVPGMVGIKDIKNGVLTMNVVSRASTSPDQGATAPANDTLTDAPHGIANGTRLMFKVLGGAPEIRGLESGTVYYVVNESGRTLQLATAQNGSPISISGSINTADYAGNYVLTDPDGTRMDHLTLEQKTALVAAEAGDVAMTYERQSFNGSVTFGLVFTVFQRDDFDIDAKSNVITHSTYQTYLGSEQTVNLEQATSGGPMIIKVAQSIIVAGAQDAQVIAPTIILEAKQGTIGTSNNPLLTDLTTPILATTLAADEFGGARLTTIVADTSSYGDTRSSVAPKFLYDARRRPMRVTAINNDGSISFATPHGFNNGDMVVYEFLPGTLRPLGGLVGATRYRARKTSDTSLMLQALNISNGQFTDKPVLGLIPSGTGHILLPEAGAGSITARASLDITMHEIAGDMWLGTVNSVSGVIRLKAREDKTAILDAIPDVKNAYWNIFGKEIRLEADYIGTASNRLDYEQNPAPLPTFYAQSQYDQFVNFAVSPTNQQIGVPKTICYLTDVKSTLGNVDYTGDSEMNVKKVEATTGIVRLKSEFAIRDDNTSGADITALKGVDLTSVKGGIGENGALEMEVGASGTVLANGMRTVWLTELTDDMNIDRVTSVTGTARLMADDSILDWFDDTAVDVEAVNLDFKALKGTIGVRRNYLEVDSSYRGAVGEVLTQSQLGTYMDESIGDMNLRNVTSLTDVVFLTADGSIIDIKSDATIKVQGYGIDLTSRRGSIGEARNDVETDLQALTELTAKAAQNIYIKEMIGAMRVVTIEATISMARLSVNETSARGEDFLMDPGDSVVAGTDILVVAGDDIFVPDGASMRAGKSITLVADNPDA